MIYGRLFNNAQKEQNRAEDLSKKCVFLLVNETCEDNYLNKAFTGKFLGGSKAFSNIGMLSFSIKHELSQKPLAIKDSQSQPSENSGDTSSDQQQIIHDTITNWQTIKRNAFVNGTTSELGNILTGAALTQTQGGVQWWANQTNAIYRDITLHSLDVQSVDFPSDTRAVAQVRISETKDNSVEGTKTSTYNATYELENINGSWYISSMKAD